MYLFRRLTWIDINVVNLITMQVLIMLRSSCISRYVKVNKYGDSCTAVFITYLLSLCTTYLHKFKVFMHKV